MLIDSIRSAEEDQADDDSTAEKICKEIAVIRDAKRMDFETPGSIKDKIIRFARGLPDGVDQFAKWFVRIGSQVDDNHPYEECLLDVMMTSLQTSISMTVLELDRDSGTAVSQQEFTCETPVYSPDIVIYVVEDDDEHTYSLAIPRKSYVLLKLLQYYREPDNR